MKFSGVMLLGFSLLPVIGQAQRFEPEYGYYEPNNDQVQKLTIERAETVVIAPLVRTHLWIRLTDPVTRPDFQQSFRAMFDTSAVLASFRVTAPFALNAKVTEMTDEFPQPLNRAQVGMIAKQARYFRYDFWVQDRSRPHEFRFECDIVQALSASDSQLFVPMLAAAEKAPLKWNMRIGGQNLEAGNSANPLNPIPIEVKRQQQGSLTVTLCSEIASDKTEYVLGVIQCPDESMPPTLSGAKEVYWISPEVVNWYEFFGAKRSSFLNRKYHRFVAKLNKGAKIAVVWRTHRGEFPVSTGHRGDSIAKLWAHQYLVQAPNLTSKSAWRIAQKNQIPHWASWWTATAGTHAPRKGGNR